MLFVTQDIFKDLDDTNVVSLTSFRPPFTPTPTPWRAQGPSQDLRDLRNQSHMQPQQTQTQNPSLLPPTNAPALNAFRQQSLPITFSSNGIRYTQVDVHPQPERISIAIPTYASSTLSSSSASNANGHNSIPTPVSASTSGSVSSLSELTPEHMRALTGLGEVDNSSPSRQDVSPSPSSASLMTPQSSIGTDTYGMTLGVGMDMNASSYSLSPSPSMTPSNDLPMFFNFEACGSGDMESFDNGSANQFSIEPLVDLGFDESLFSSFDFDFEADIVDVGARHQNDAETRSLQDMNDSDAQSSTETVIPSTSSSSSTVTPSSITFPSNKGKNAMYPGEMNDLSSFKGMGMDMGVDSNMDIAMINFFDSFHQE